MRRYVSNIDIRNLALGAGSGGALTTGDDNVLLGAGAGAALTTGSRNVILGGYTASEEPSLSDAVVLSGATGRVCVRWDAQGNATTTIHAASTVAAPAAPNTATMAFDDATGAVVWRVCDGAGVERTSAAVAAGAAAAVPRLETEPGAAPGSVSLVGPTSGADPAVLRTCGLVAGEGIALRAEDGGATLRVVNTSDAASGVTLVDLGGDPAAGAVGLTAPGLAVRRLVPGAGIALRLDPADGGVAVCNASPATDVTLRAPAGAAGADLVLAGAGPHLALRRLAAGPGVQAVESGDAVVLAALTTLESEAAEAGAAHSLVGDSSAPPVLRTKRVGAGWGLAAVPSAGALTLRAVGPWVAALRPADVTLTTGCVVVRPGAVRVAPGLGWPAEVTPYPLAALVVRAVAPHRGCAVGTVGALPSFAHRMGFECDVTTVAAAACTWRLCLARTVPGTASSEVVGELRVPASDRPATRSVAWTAPSAGAVACHDGVLRPAFGVSEGEGVVGATEPVCLRVESSPDQTADVHVLALRFTLHPPAVDGP